MNNPFEDIQFPQYRRYKNGLSCFKIISTTEFIEKQKIGSRTIENYIMAKQLPERNLIYDLVLTDLADKISDTDFNAF